MSDLPSEQLRPTDAGTENEWTFVGGGKVFVWRLGLPAVLGRLAPDRTPHIAVYPNAARPLSNPLTSEHIIVTPHQARALMEILPAAIALAEELED